jgi:hypothetical protein
VRPSLIAAAMLLVFPCAPGFASAQPEARAPAAAAVGARADPAALGIAAGTPIDIELAEAVSSKTHKRGDRFAIRLIAPVMLAGRPVLPAGLAGVGEVVDAAPAGPLGRPAKLLLAARYLDLRGAHVPLRSFRLGVAGKDTSNIVMAGSYVPYAGVLALFIHGGEIEIPAGTQSHAKIAVDLDADGVPLPAGSAAPAPPAAP